MRSLSYLCLLNCLDTAFHHDCLQQQQNTEQLINLRHVYLLENITVLQLHIVRDKGLFGDISIHLIAKPNFLLHINNQATENEDYVLQDAVIIMKENIKETYAEVAILPVSIDYNKYEISQHAFNHKIAFNHKTVIL